MKIAIGSDHAGFTLKEGVKKFLSHTDLEITDIGTYSNESVDYPDFGMEVARLVSSCETERGILICGSGVGMSIVANRFPGVRAALSLDTETAIMSRKHNDSNILVLAGRRSDIESAKPIISAWLETEFEGGRHQRRLDKIGDMESVIK
ncbi:MAG: ribose 5-phosphate isomerase B [Thermodesulfobacteriota bacterium]|nr:ribose 5-phosphate isomerase B [Thermodesulfobacteriota bacterium]